MNLCKEERIHWQQRERKMQMDERTFRVTVSSQQYHTWQGALEYENRKYSFLSELDLVRMMDDFLRDNKEKTDTEE